MYDRRDVIIAVNHGAQVFCVTRVRVREERTNIFKCMLKHMAKRMIALFMERF